MDCTTSSRQLAEHRSSATSVSLFKSSLAKELLCRRVPLFPHALREGNLGDFLTDSRDFVGSLYKLLVPIELVALHVNITFQSALLKSYWRKAKHDDMTPVSSVEIAQLLRK
ncbi:hypothetical protein TNIN_211781 [Trichonephila inaurata madagascariensis]|uniref:Uncharacterized protein n=1 Tax=Trichonephila inaurata madagascariensis TaxID=2747483 RepID=A0A8X7BX68_9ARAC|nr:hypothetical protein TNIN_211781 [Trichonephila inaurata madagascariensis]